MEVAKIKIRLGRLRVPLIKAGIKILDKWLVSKINVFEPLENYARKRLGLLEKILDKLTDKDPNNKEQLQEVWQEHLQEELGDLREFIVESIPMVIKDPLKAAIALEVFSEMLQEQDDEEQALMASAASL